MAPAPKIQRILVPHDFEETAETALTYALTLAEKLGARVTVLHAYEVPTYGYPEMLAVAVEFASEIERRAVENLEKIAREARRPNVEVDTMVRRGSPWVEIVEMAKKLPADLIVMGTHGRRGMPRLLLGSVAEKVVRSAHCPVLTMHAVQS
jgi:nucleotide-binding universal stress UspA family protein